MAQAKNIHIIDLSKNLMDRFQTVKFEPNYILNRGVDEGVIKEIYPRAQFVKEGRADFILGAVELSEEGDLTELLTQWRKCIKPNGLLLFGLINFTLDIQEIGDFLLWLGFVNVVMDCEDNVVYGHAWGPDEISVKLSQIRRAS